MNTTVPKLIAVDAHVMTLLLQQLFPETVQGSANEDMQVLKVNVLADILQFVHNLNSDKR